MKVTTFMLTPVQQCGALVLAWPQLDWLQHKPWGAQVLQAGGRVRHHAIGEPTTRGMQVSERSGTTLLVTLEGCNGIADKGATALQTWAGL